MPVLLHLTSFTEGKGDLAFTRAWKGHDWEALNRLHQKGLISDPKSKAKSVGLSKEGSAKAEALFQRLVLPCAVGWNVPLPGLFAGWH